MNDLPIFSRWLWKYVGYIINISLHSQIIGSYFWWYLCSILSFQQTKYSLLATDRVSNPPTYLRIIRKSLFFFQQWGIEYWDTQYSGRTLPVSVIVMWGITKKKFSTNPSNIRYKCTNSYSSFIALPIGNA